MTTITSLTEFNTFRENLTGSIGLVPTMGALHDGHLSLVKKSNQVCDNTIVSIFINPTQFSPNEDLDTYPKTIKGDIELLKTLNVGAIFLPTNEDIYPNGYSTFINEESLSRELEGKSRPSFFKGVTTILVKLFNIVNPTHSFFGQKDAQQLRVVKKIVSDLNFNIKIISCPTIREKNGLAMSSRNKNLSNCDRQKAAIIYKSLCHSISLLNNGERDANNIKKEISKILLTEQSISIDYISVANEHSLKEIDNAITTNILISIAICIKNIRLIDNISFYIANLD